MYYAAIDSESLTNPTILNDFPAQMVVIEYEPNSTSKYHHVFLLKLDDNKISSLTTTIDRFLKEEWYVLYWNENQVKIQFKNNIFDDVYKGLSFGQKHGIDVEFLDFKKYITRYNQLIVTNNQ